MPSAAQPLTGAQLAWWGRDRRHVGLVVMGLFDGRRGLPAVTAEGADAPPALHRIHDEYAGQVAQALGQARAATLETRLALATLEAPEGELCRARQRLAEMEDRLAAVADGVGTGRRDGEGDLSEDMVLTRRRREFERRRRAARKRVEDERTAVSNLQQTINRMKAVIDEQDALARAQVAEIAAEARTRVSAYLGGALRSHPDREGLTEHVDALLALPATTEDLQ